MQGTGSPTRGMYVLRIESQILNWKIVKFTQGVPLPTTPTRNDELHGIHGPRTLLLPGRWSLSFVRAQYLTRPCHVADGAPNLTILPIPPILYPLLLGVPPAHHKITHEVFKDPMIDKYGIRYVRGGVRSPTGRIQVGRWAGGENIVGDTLFVD